MTLDSFLAPRLRVRTLDTYLVRRAILRSLYAARPSFWGTVVDLGCGFQPYRDVVLRPPSRGTGYVGVDLPGTAYGWGDVAWDGDRLPLATRSAGTVLLTEVLEHCPAPDRIVSEAARVLKPGGVVFATVPFLWPLHEVPNDQWRPTPFALDRVFRGAGLVDVEILALGGWDAALAQTLGLWVRRRLSGSRRARVLRGLLSPLVLLTVAVLARLDRPPVRFEEGSLITGLSVLAFAPAPDRAAGRQ